MNALCLCRASNALAGSKRARIITRAAKRVNGAAGRVFLSSSPPPKFGLWLLHSTFSTCLHNFSKPGHCCL